MGKELYDNKMLLLLLVLPPSTSHAPKLNVIPIVKSPIPSGFFCMLSTRTTATTTAEREFHPSFYCCERTAMCVWKNFHHMVKLLQCHVNSESTKKVSTILEK
jgi:hypothetical protein